MKCSTFGNIPLDTRHLEAKNGKRGGIRGSRNASLKDFPSEWLPSASNIA